MMVDFMPSFPAIHIRSESLEQVASIEPRQRSAQVKMNYVSYLMLDIKTTGHNKIGH